VCALAFPLFAQSLLRVYADERHYVHVVSSGKDTVIAVEEDQVGIDAIKVVDDKQIAGWLVLYKDPDGGSPIAGKLVVWRDSRIQRSFPADQVFWSWSFEHSAEQVAYHVGPPHGETASHCELHDLQTGRLLSSWDGDLENPHRPTWTKQLNH
jgi:hypothetical protein